MHGCHYTYVVMAAHELDHAIDLISSSEHDQVTNNIHPSTQFDKASKLMQVRISNLLKCKLGNGSLAPHGFFNAAIQ